MAAYKIGAVARMTRLSVRALHHYDAIDLVRPSGRSAAGYRLYTTGDLERLQQVLFFRELGFALEAIREILADPDFDRRSALEAQRTTLQEQSRRANALVSLIDETLRTMKRGDAMKPEEMFDGFDPARYDDEARSRWGKTDSYQEAARRTKRCSTAERTRMRAEAGAIVAELADALAAGVAPSDARAMDAAERHRLHIDQWFYPCPYLVHVGLGEMYVADERFAATYERRRAGLAEYIRSAIQANAASRR